MQNSLISSQSLTLEDILQIISLAHDIQNNSLNEKYLNVLEDQLIFSIFLENSTRTLLSFSIAAQKLKAQFIPFQANLSSLSKGETYEDTIHTLSAFGAKYVVLRAKDNNLISSLANLNSNISFINAGNGIADHPTQALIDLYTIHQKSQLKMSYELNIAICGDILHSRVAAANMAILSKFGYNIYLIGPPELLPSEEEIRKKMNYNKIFVEYEMDNILDDMDIVMLLRIQHERLEGKLSFSLDKYFRSYGLTKERFKKMKKDSYIMHPGPVNRNVELDESLIYCDHSLIYSQLQNSIAIRQAVFLSFI